MRRERDVEDVELVAAHELEQHVERPGVARRLDVECHAVDPTQRGRARTATPRRAGRAGAPSLGSRDGAHLLGHPADRRRCTSATTSAPSASGCASRDEESLFCLVDLHALTIDLDPDELRRGTLEVAAGLLAAGLDPSVCTLFVQSHVAEHTELAWLLECTATYGELRRMTQFKEKAAAQRGRSAAGCSPTRS